MNDYIKVVGDYLLQRHAPQEVFSALVSVEQRLVAYAIDKHDAELALGWKGIPLAEGDSVATGIERLYEKLSAPSKNATKLFDAMTRWKAETPSREQRENALADKLKWLHRDYQEMMAEWADTDFTSPESDTLEAQIDVLHGQVMELLPLTVKTLRHMDEPSAASAPDADTPGQPLVARDGE